VLARAQKRCGRTKGNDCTDRDAAAEPLRQRHDVGHDAVPGVGEPLPGAADAGLHLVDDEQGAVRAGDLAGGGEVALGQRADPGLALDRLEHDRGDVVRHGRAQRLDVAERQVLDAAGQRLERLAVRRSVGQGERPQGASVEGALERQDPRAPGAAGDLEGALVGLGTGVGEEHP